MRDFSKLSKDELVSILTTISMYVYEAEYEKKEVVKRELIYNSEGNLNDSFRLGHEDGVNIMCNALKELMK